MEIIRKIDIHAHAIISELTPPYMSSGKRFLTAEQNIAFYDQLNIETGVLLPIISPEAHWFSMTNESAKMDCDRHPDRLVWFCNVDPRSGDNTDRTDLSLLLNYYKALGAKGVGEVTANLPADHPMMDNLFGHCEACGLPVLIHISPAVGVSYGIVDDPGLPRIERMLKKHPGMKLIGHSQPFWAEISEYGPEENRLGYPKGKVKEGALVRLMRDYGNLNCDLSAGSGMNAMKRDPEFAARFFEEFADRIFYGCDMCAVTNTHQFEFDAFLTDMREKSMISEENYRRIVRNNAIDLLNLPMEKA